jgi:hypothetical protein
MYTNPNATELLRLRDELDELDGRVPEDWSFRVAVVVAFLIAVFIVLGVALESFPLAILTALLGCLVVYERKARRARLREEREVIERRIRMIEESSRN